MLFEKITLHNFKRPLRDRLESRKRVGPYTWTPSAPGTTRGFYQSTRDNLVMGDSTINLRLEYAQEIARKEGMRLADTNGYYVDESYDTTLIPIVARLPRQRGFLAGWTMGEGMAATLKMRIYSDAIDAAISAYSIAERDAESERDYQEAWNAGREFADMDELIATNKKRIHKLNKEIKQARESLGAESKKTLREKIAHLREENRECESRKSELLDSARGALSTLRDAFNEGAGKTWFV